METQSNNYVFPPNAFQLTDELKAALNQVPETILSSPCSLLSAPTRRFDCSLLSANCSLIPFPAFESSGLTDYMGRTVYEALEAVRQLTGFTLPVTSENAENNIRLGRSFWAALIRGSYQGAVYYIDNLGEK